MQTGNQPVRFPALWSGSTFSLCRRKGTFTTMGVSVRRRRNCPVWAFRHRFTLCGHKRRGDMVPVYPGIPQLSLLTIQNSQLFLKISSCTAPKTWATSFHVLLGFTLVFWGFFNMKDRKVWGKRNGFMKMAFTVSYKYTGLTSLWISNQGRFKGHR